MVLLALVVFSRIGVLLALLGFALAHLMGIQLRGDARGLLPLVLGYNFILTAMALGGVWFVPSLSSFVFAAAGVLICGMVTIGLLPFLTWNGIPLLILPFNLTVILLLYAMRQRVRDGRPKAVDFLLGTPEENLNYFRTRVEPLRRALPGPLSGALSGPLDLHPGRGRRADPPGPWRHALDFEVAGHDGELHRGEGTSLPTITATGCPCWPRPTGRWPRCVDGVVDNPGGEVNLKDNWGNLVLIYHAPGLYSMVCHLSPGTIKVREGQIVRRGDTLGLCGNSGRSPAAAYPLAAPGDHQGRLPDNFCRAPRGGPRE